MLLMVEKGVRGGKCHAIHQYVKVSSHNVTKVTCWWFRVH